jgi:cyclic lactone autoinducer peptide
MKKIEARIFKAIANLGYKSAVKACNTTSIAGCYQPKEPSALKNLKK